MRNRLSFTMIEVIFVIIIIGIISLGIVRKGGDSSFRQGRDQIISHLRQTQHLALMDDRFLPSMEFAPADKSQAYKEAITKDWRNSMWRFQIHDLRPNSNNDYVGATYSIYSDRPTDSGVWKNQPQGYALIARNPLNNKCLSYISKNNLPNECKNNRDKRLRLSTVFGIVSMRVSSQCGDNKASETIFFDPLGAPYCGSTKNGSKPVKLTRQAKIVLKGKLSSEGAVICIAPETGMIYADHEWVSGVEECRP